MLEDHKCSIISRLPGISSPAACLTWILLYSDHYSPPVQSHVRLAQGLFQNNHQPMKTFVIRQRVADFLKRHTPFDALSEQYLLELAGSGKVIFHESEEYLFRQGDTTGKFLWIIQQGQVELLDVTPSGERLRDRLGEGDLLGLERFVGEGTYLYSARTATDVILYGVSADLFEPLVAQYPSVRRFLSAHCSVSGIRGFNKTSWLEAEVPPLEFLRARLVALPLEVTMADARAGLVGSRNGIAALVDDDGRPLGTITALELCASPAGSVRAAARQCPPAVAAPLSTRVVVREMLRLRTEQLAITTDGTPASRLDAILTSSELAMFSGHDPMGLISAIRRADSAAEIKPLLTRAIRILVDGLAQPHDIDDCCLIGTEVIAAVAKACIRMAEHSAQKSAIARARAPYCFVMFGAMARGDLVGLGLPTIAAVYDDSDESSKPEDSLYFGALAGETAAMFHACGLAGPAQYWPEGAQPSMPLSEWIRLYGETIRNPLGHDLYARREFFDLRPLSGDPSIFRKLQDHIMLEFREHETAIPLLANDTLIQLTPLTFFRGLVLELDGGQRDSFNISEAVVSPLADAARVFALAKRRLTPANTLERFDTAQIDFPQGASIINEAADAFRIGLYYQFQAGCDLVTPRNLGKFDQLLLKTAFSSIRSFLEFTLSTFVGNA